MILFADDPGMGILEWQRVVGAGLLGMVLAWLFLRHLPAKDQQLKDILQSHEDERDRMAARLEAQAEGFRASLAAILAHCRTESERVIEVFRAEIARNGGKGGL